MAGFFLEDELESFLEEGGCHGIEFYGGGCGVREDDGAEEAVSSEII